MIRLYKILGFFLLVFITVSCKKSIITLDVSKTITKYHLDLESGYYNLDNTCWQRNGQIFANRATDSCLIVLINKKGDTILTHLDKGIECWYSSIMIKDQGEYFVVKRDFKFTEHDSTKLDYKPLQESKPSYGYGEIDYPMDTYYRLDSIHKKLEPIRLLPKIEIVEKIKEKIDFKGNITVLASSNKNTYIAKDTLNDSQVYYEIATVYALKKREKEWLLESSFSSKNSDVYKMGIYKNNITSYTQNIGNTLVTISVDTLGQNVSKYAIYLKEYSKFSRNTERYPYCHNELIKLEIILQDRTKREKKIMETFADIAFFKYQHFNLFKYRNGEYFIGVLPEIEKGYEQNLFHLDTINWKMDRVMKFNKKTDLNFTRYKKKEVTSFMSGDTMGKMTQFLEEYEIIKVKDGYRLITPDS